MSPISKETREAAPTEEIEVQVDGESPLPDMKELENDTTTTKATNITKNSIKRSWRHCKKYFLNQEAVIDASSNYESMIGNDHYS